MKGIGKAIGAGIAVIIVGVIVFVVALGLNGWKLEDVGNYEIKTYECETAITEIKLDFALGTLKTRFYDGDKIKIEYPENDKLTTTVTESNGTLTASANTSKHWWLNFGTWFRKIPTTVISIPQNSVVGFDIQINRGTVDVAEGTYGNVKIELNAGTLNFGKTICDSLNCTVSAGTLKVTGVTCDKVICDISAGTVNLSNVLCDDIKVDISAGTANIGIKGNKSEYNIDADVSAGSCNVKSQNGSDAGKRVTVDVSAGSANINFN